MEITDFKEPLQKALAAMHIVSFARVQDTMKDVLDGRDLLVNAPTGSGKTLAYLLPLLQKMKSQGKGRHLPHALILVPTRELAIQTAATARKLLSYEEGIRTAILTGGVDMQAQIRSFHHGADLVIGTPARIKDHLRRHTLKTQEMESVVLDECDVMLSMGFVQDVMDILNDLPVHQTLLYSATFTPAVLSLSHQIQKDPIQVTVKHDEAMAQHIAIHALITPENRKLDALKNILKAKHALVFCNTRKTCAFVADHLPQAKAIHSEMDMKERKEIMADFRSGTLPVLVATDVAARGIDIPFVSLVICYDLPDDHDSLIHRVGRASRDGRQSDAWIFLTPAQQNADLEGILHQEVQRTKMQRKPRRK
ncbi:DEAD/DEAH box helicase [Stecheria sp. CLA-KB-P133]|uniref:DEAD/DEAH box helicase n=1 Tax=Grylomicrobium aquisgranensis TaxID=2926318 RepID=A0AB35U3N7_9FIRM|nr:DEAD/DEAH box helicase [Lactimicrobium massiliense]MDD6674814.1 DEAD/DEAH box helicase [Lactimicrobium massiliense]MDX8419186.1 DEAD/DEAH box helicase [Stecheria sp. CLA-KB-P133]